MSTVCETIESLCKEKGISIYQLSISTGISYDIFQAIRKGTRQDLSYSIAYKLAVFFDRPVCVFMEGTTMEENVGQRIHQCRLAVDKTMKELAEEVGTTTATLCKWETGQTPNFGVQNLVLLARALNTSPNALVGWEAETSIRHHEQQIISKIRCLPDADVELLAKITDTMYDRIKPKRSEERRKKRL